MLRFEKKNRKTQHFFSAASIVRCIVEKAGRIGSRVRVNLSEIPLNLPTITHKDKQDLILAAKEKVDMVMVSSTKYAETINKVREILTGFCIHRETLQKIDLLL